MNEFRFTIAEKVREVCIAKNWYTRGTNDEYDHLFELISNGAAIMDIADDIYCHSTFETAPSVGCIYKEIEEIVNHCKKILNE